MLHCSVICHDMLWVMMVPLVFCPKEPHEMVKSVSIHFKSTVDAVNTINSNQVTNDAEGTISSKTATSLEMVEKVEKGLEKLDANMPFSSCLFLLFQTSRCTTFRMELNNEGAGKIHLHIKGAPRLALKKRERKIGNGLFH